MNKSIALLLVAVGVLVLALWVPADAQKKDPPKDKPAVQKWEYKSVSAVLLGTGKGAGADSDAKLNELGAEGWELAAIQPSTNASPNGARYVFKRPLVSNAPQAEPKKDNEKKADKEITVGASRCVFK